MFSTRRNPSPCTMGRASAFGAALAVSTLLLAGCGGGSQNVEQLLLTAPNTDIAVTIPTGWHQVIDSTNPSTAEMVFPTTCMGNAEVTCATGLARLATFAAPSAEAAAQTVQRAISTSPGVRAASITSQGPGKVGQRDGHRLRFTFANASAKLVSEVAAVPTGSPTPDAQGNHEFSIVLVWISDAPSAPKQDTIDQVIASALFVGGHP
ncbi:MAG: hypothetical protein WBL53_03795 [Pseudonocardiaceae bacterium]